MREERVKAWQIFRHSVRQVVGNLPGALRVSLVPVAIQVAVMLALAGVAGPTGGLLEPAAPDAGFVLGTILALVVVVATALWIAVAWHRYVLLSEEPKGFVPAFHGDRIAAYLLRSLAYLVVLVVVAVVLSFVQSAIANALSVSSVSAFMILMLVIVLMPTLTVGLRLSSGLPGAAIGATGDFTAGWRATTGATGDIAGLAVILVLAQTALQLVGFALSSADLSILSFAWEVVTSWLVTMVGVSVLTTLYGHYVEGRTLV